MKRGLVIGKFMPLHQGHMALINFAVKQCDELIVSMSFTDADPIDAKLRFNWLRETLSTDKRIQVHHIPDDFDRPELPLKERTEIWAARITKVYPAIDCVFSSEDYGPPFAEALGATHIEFDPKRKTVPISASRIRQRPFTNWNFIPEIVRPYFVKRFCFFGAESTGKSTMAINMAKHYDTIFVPEVAREMLVSNQFTAEDIERIGQAHHARILEAQQYANKILFCDTDVLTTQIYSDHYLGVIPSVLFEYERTMIYDHYFLFDIDVPWVADGLRDLSNHREEMHQKFRDALLIRKIPFTEVRGSWKEREAIIIAKIDSMIGNL